MKKRSAILSHTILTLILYSLNACFHTKLGKALTNKGIRRPRDENMSTIHKLFVFSEEYFAIFDVEEYSIIVRAPPKIFFHIIQKERSRLGGINLLSPEMSLLVHPFICLPLSS